MKPVFKPGKRVKFRGLRGSVLSIVLTATGWDYIVTLDMGARVRGSKYQFVPARRSC